MKGPLVLLLRSPLILLLITPIAIGGCSDDVAGGRDAAVLDGATDAAGGCGGSCGAPFVCRADDTDAQTMRCLSPKGDIPGCDGSPSGQVVPFTLTDTNKPVHWSLSPGCIATSYGAGLSSRAAMISDAVKAINDVTCSTLCLEAPTQLSDPPDYSRAERRIHLQVGSTNGTRALATTYFERPTGRLLSVTIDIKSDELASLTSGDLLHLLGNSVGLANVAKGTDSVMADPDPAAALSSADESALCTLYGSSGSYCGD